MVYDIVLYHQRDSTGDQCSGGALARYYVADDGDTPILTLFSSYFGGVGTDLALRARVAA